MRHVEQRWLCSCASALCLPSMFMLRCESKNGAVSEISLYASSKWLPFIAISLEYRGVNTTHALLGAKHGNLQVFNIYVMVQMFLRLTVIVCYCHAKIESDNSQRLRKRYSTAPTQTEEACMKLTFDLNHDPLNPTLLLLYSIVSPA